MNQAILKPNEFIIRVDETEDALKFTLVNPHIEVGADKVYDLPAFSRLKTMMLLFERFTPKPKTDDQSYPELHAE